MRRLLFVPLFLITFAACSHKELRPLTEKEREILFIKDHIPSPQQCKYLGKVTYIQDDNPRGGLAGKIVGCAVYENQAFVFIEKAAKMDANLIVADFARTDRGFKNVPDHQCENEAKVFKCSEKAMKELKRYE